MELSEAARQARNEYKRRYSANLSEEAKQKQREYMREWKKRNPEKVQQYQVNFWERKVSSLTRAILQEAEIADRMHTDLNDKSMESIAIEMREQGCTLPEIGVRLNISHEEASSILNDCNEDTTTTSQQHHSNI